jgi:hypothetical protein
LASPRVFLFLVSQIAIANLFKVPDCDLKDYEVPDWNLKIYFKKELTFKSTNVKMN